MVQMERRTTVADLTIVWMGISQFGDQKMQTEMLQQKCQIGQEMKELDNGNIYARVGGMVFRIWGTVDQGGSVAEWLACWTQPQQAWVQIAVATLVYDSRHLQADYQ